MTPSDAAKLLELPSDATPDQLEARFHELRSKLEEKIGKAPTPGLKAKYRETLDGITLAFETLTLAADSSSLPVLQKQRTDDGGPRTAGGTATPPRGSDSANPKSSPARRASAIQNRTEPAGRQPAKSGKEFALVAIIAVAVLGAGGWFVMKTRAENAEKARIAIEAKLASERQAAAEKAEQERKVEEQKQQEAAEKMRQETLFAQLRGSQAEFKIRWDSLEKETASAERKLSELKSDTRNTRDLPAPQVAELQAQYAAQGDYVEWLQSYMSRHPVRTELARLDALLGAKAVDDAAALVAALTQSLAAAEAELAAQKKSLLALTGPVTLTSEPSGLAYTLTDVYGRTAQGTTPFDGDLPLGALAVKIQRGSGWTDYEQKIRVKRGEPLMMNAVFGHGKLQVTSSPAGLSFEVENTAGFTRSGTTPAELAEVPGGEVSARITRKDWPDFVQTVQVTAGGSQAVLAEFSPGTLEVTSTPSGAEVWIGDKKLGVTPLTITDQIPGRITGEVRLQTYRRAAFEGELLGKQTLRLSAMLEGEPAHGDTITIPGLGLTLIRIGQGSFQMGDASGEAHEKPVHTVTISRPFWLGKYEVTQAEWTAVMGSNPSNFKDDDRPVEQVSWTDVMEFCRKLTERERTAGRLPEGAAFTLPTEAQWEYACRAGTTGDYAGSLDAMGWYSANSGSTTHPVGQKQANAWGLHDMHGNVLEWCADWNGGYPGGSVTDPTGAASGAFLVARGGGCGSVAANCRSANRGWIVPGHRGNALGFRLALVPVHREMESPKAPNTELAEFMQPFRGRWKVVAGRYDRKVRYEDYLTVSDDGLTMTHHATNGPERGTQVMPLTLLDAQRGLVLAERWPGQKGQPVYRLKNDRIDSVEGGAVHRNGQWMFAQPGILTNSWLTVDQLPLDEETPPLYWRYQRAN